jgi:hypothetical protein
MAPQTHFQWLEVQEKGVSAIGKHQYGYSWMQATVKARQDADRAKSSPREELKTYLAAPLEYTDNAVGWWLVGG